MSTAIIAVLFIFAVIAVSLILFVSSESDSKHKGPKRNPYECFTEKGEHVKSYGEKDIADFLYHNDIQYIYEDRYPYEHNYHPDFHIVGTKIWIEYFGTDRNGNVPSFMGSSEEYRKGIAWKRSCHTRHGTTLISLYSYERQEGTLLIHLRKALYTYGIRSELPYGGYRCMTYTQRTGYGDNLVSEEIVIGATIPRIGEISDNRDSERSVMDILRPYTTELRNGFVQVRYGDIVVNLSPEQQKVLDEMRISDYESTGVPRLDGIVKDLLK